MKALVYHAPGRITWEDRDDPIIQHPTDVIVKIEAATVCGTDIHIAHGVHSEVVPGTVLGHEGIGKVVQVGADVRRFSLGDKVVIPPITSCGSCRRCKRGRAAQCQTFAANGWLLGHIIDGVQAEYARIPMADASLHRLPDELPPEEAILAVDVFASAYEMGVENAEVSEDDTVVVIGDGPIGISAALLARQRKPAVVILAGIHAFRRDVALSLGADHVVDTNEDDWVEKVRALCPDGGADAVIEAVGSPETLEAAFALVQTFGRVANIGVHTGPVSFPIQDLWIKAITVRTGMVSCTSTAFLLDQMASGKLNGKALISHQLPLSQAKEAYEIFESAAETKATKIVLLQ